MIYIKIFKFFILFIAFTVCGCTNKTPLANYKQNSIRITIDANNSINSFDGASHTLVLRVFQINNIQNFRTLIETTKGIEQLIKKDKFDNTFVSNNQFIIIPGEKKEIRIDRFEDTKYLGIVAGFYKYDDIKKVSLDTVIPTEKRYLLFGDEEYIDLLINLKIYKDSIYAEISK